MTLEILWTSWQKKESRRFFYWNGEIILQETVMTDRMTMEL